MSSPDGKWVVYGVSDPQRVQRTASKEEFSPSGVSLEAVRGLRLIAVQLASSRTVDISGPGGSTWGAAWSPDSRHLAFYSDRGGYAALWLWDALTGLLRQVTRAPVHPFFRDELPVWSSGGKTILVKLTPEGMPAHAAPKANDPGFNHATKSAGDASPTEYAYAPDQPKSTGVISRSSPESTMQAADARFRSDLALVSVPDGGVRRLVRNSRVTWYAFSPDNRLIAYQRIKGWDPQAQQKVCELDVIQTASGGRVKAVATYMFTEFPGRVSWSPDGKRLAYQTVGPATDNAVHVVDVVDASAAVRTHTLRPPTEGKGQAPLWSSDGKTIFAVDHVNGRIASISPDTGSEIDLTVPGGEVESLYRDSTGREPYWTDNGRSILVEYRDSSSGTLRYCNFALSAQRCGQTSDPRQRLSLGVPPAGRPQTLPYFSTGAQDPGTIGIANACFCSLRQLSKINPTLSDAILGEVEVIDFDSLQGKPLKAALMLPAGYTPGQRYPLVIQVYAGSLGSDELNAFGFSNSPEFNMQVLASRGFAVLIPDVPLDHKMHQPMQDVYNSVMPAVDEVLRRGIADQSRLFLMGQSFGGYNVIGLVTQTDRFAGAIASSAAAVDLFQGFAQFNHGISSGVEYYVTGQGGMGCTPWKCRERYLANSPFFNLDKVKTPLLMERGMDDGTSIQEREVFVSLRELRGEVTLLEYGDEGHVLDRSEDLHDYWTRVLAFLDSHHR